MGLAVANDLEKGGVPFITMNAAKIFKMDMISVIIFLTSDDFL